MTYQGTTADRNLNLQLIIAKQTLSKYLMILNRRFKKSLVRLMNSTALRTSRSRQICKPLRRAILNPVPAEEKHNKEVLTGVKKPRKSKDNKNSKLTTEQKLWNRAVGNEQVYFEHSIGG